MPTLVVAFVIPSAPGCGPVLIATASLSLFRFVVSVGGMSDENPSINIVVHTDVNVVF